MIDERRKVYFCHECSIEVDVNIGIENEMTCKDCESVFVEERKIEDVSPLVQSSLTPRVFRRTMVFNVGRNTMNDSDFSEYLVTRFMESVPKETSSGLEKEVFEKLKESERKVREDELKDSCPVCQDKYSDSRNVIELSCSHKFCSDCVLPWLKKKNSCPVCREEVKFGK